MRRLDPSYELPLIDFWDPDTVDLLDHVRRKKGRARAFDARIGAYALTYEAGTSIPVMLEIRDARTGRRLRQDGEDDPAILHRLEERCSTETR